MFSNMSFIKRKTRDLSLKVIHKIENNGNCNFSIISKEFSNKENIYLNNFGILNSDGHATIFYDKEESRLASLYQRNLDAYSLELNQTEEV